jgi:shikimate dehydrogenase
VSAVRVAPGQLLLIGHPVSHSLSPRFQNAALAAAGIELQYRARDVAPEELERVAAELREVGAAGNVTVPHKERMAALCDRVTPLAEQVGAVNTFWVEHALPPDQGDGALDRRTRDQGDGALDRSSGRILVGDNTDVEGAAAALERLLGGPPADCRVLLLGAGGAAAAVLAALARWPGNTVAVRNRDRARAERLVARFGYSAQCSDDAMDVERAHIVINATSLGLHQDDALPCDPARMRADAAVLDLVYRRGCTAWVRAAHARGLRAADGTVMLVEQGAAAFERWFGITPDKAVMWRSLTD